MTIQQSRRPVAAARMAALARNLLNAAPLCAIATVAPGSRAHVNTAYFAWSPEFDLRLVVGAAGETLSEHPREPDCGDRRL